jgi:hypothetical protein
LSFSLKNNFILDNGAYIGWRNSSGNTVGAIKTDTQGNIFFNSLNGDIYLNHASGGNIDFIYINGVISASNLSLTNFTSNSSIINNLNATTISVANLNVPNISFVNLTSTNSTITNGIFTNISCSSISSTSSTIPNSVFTNITTTNISVINTLNANTISVANLTFTNSTISNIVASTSTIPNTVFTNISSSSISSISSTMQNSVFTNISSNSAIISSNVNIKNIATIGNSITSTTANLFVNGAISSNAVKSNQAGSLSSFSGGDIGFYYVGGGTLQFVNSGANTASISNNGTFLSANVNTGNKLNTFGVNYQGVGYNSTQTSNYIQASLNLNTAVNNSGTTADTPYPVLNLIKGGVSGQSYDSVAAFYLNRFSTSGVNANTELQLGLANGIQGNGTDTNTITWKYRSDGTTYALGTVNSTDTSTGTLVINGGVAIQKNLNVGANINCTANIVSNSYYGNSSGFVLYTNSTNKGISINSSGDLSGNSTTDSSSKVTGSITTQGGMGINKSLYVGGNIVSSFDTVSTLRFYTGSFTLNGFATGTSAVGLNISNFSNPNGGLPGHTGVYMYNVYGVNNSGYAAYGSFYVWSPALQNVSQTYSAGLSVTLGTGGNFNIDNNSGITLNIIMYITAVS